MKILYVDFCGTVTFASTLKKFCRYVLLKNGIFSKLYYYLYLILHNKYLKIIQIDLFVPFNNMPNKLLEKYSLEFFNIYISKNLNEKTINLITKYKEAGYYIVIISGGLTNYIKHINKIVNIDHIIAKEFIVDKNRIKTEFSTGTVFQNEKIFKISEFENNLDHVIDERVVISDSEDDIPLFLLADKKILVNPTSKRLAAYAKLNNWQIL
jgi:HAD superfamily phosphoserine phosphatase-like hydrolase